MIEMVVVVAILGLLSAVGLPLISDFTDSATEGRSQSNAQKLANTYSVALLAGHDFAEGETELSSVVNKVVDGTTVLMADSPRPVFVGMPTISNELQAEALPYLEFRTGRLFYKYSND